MSEERLLVLNMLRDGKLTPEQADSLLRAMRDPDPKPASPPPPPTPDPSTLASVQSRLADLQNKIGEIQGRQVADRAARMAVGAASFAGKVIGQIPRPEIDFRKALDETLSGLNSLKDDAVKTAKQAAVEAKRLAKEGKQAVANGAGSVSFTESYSTVAKRPTPAGRQAATDSFEMTNSFVGTNVTIVNRFGDVRVRPGVADLVEIRGEKTAWAETDADARVLLQQVFTTNRLENGTYRIDLVTPVDARDRVTVDLTILVPKTVSCEVETTFGDIHVHEAGAELTIRSMSGDVNAENAASGAGDTRIATRSGSIRVANWRGIRGGITAQTISGDIATEGITATGDIILHSQSGDIGVHGLDQANALSAESINGDIQLQGTSVATQAGVKTQSGNINAQAVRAGQLNLESVSGDVNIDDVGGALTLKSVSGDINARAVNSYAVALNSVSGDIAFGFAAPHSGSLAGTSVSGDIKLELWSNSDTRITAASTSGDVHCHITGLTGDTSDHSNFSGTLGSGSGSVRLQSISGDLNIEEHGRG